MAQPDEIPAPRLHLLVGVTLVVAILYFTQEILLPFALAALLSFLLSPLVTWLERRNTGRIAATLIAVGLAMGFLVALTWFMTNQILDLAGQLPTYKETLRTKARTVNTWLGGSGGELTETFKEVRKELTKAAEETRPPALKEEPAEGKQDPRPGASREWAVKVEIVEDQRDPLAYRLVRDWSAWLLGPLGQAAVVIVFVIFMLLQREDLRDRVIKLAGTGHVHETTQAIDEAAARVSRYLLMQLIINATYGLAVAAGLWIIGVPNPVLWGVFATVFRFVPYIGPWIAAILPLGLAIAVDEAWGTFFWSVGLFVVLELFSNNVMEPWLYGTSTGLSAVGVIAAAAFWTWLWGPIGLVLSMPLTVCAIVLGRHVPQLKFLNILLSDQPALEVGVRFYQRLLAFDDYEAGDLLGTFQQTGTLEDAYEKVVLPALSMAERDRHENRLTDNQVRFIHRFLRAQVRSLPSQFDRPPEDVTPGAAGGPEVAPPVPPDQALSILCLPAEDIADRLAGRILAQLLVLRGHRGEALPFRAGSRQAIDQIREREPAVVVISAVAPGAAIPAQRAVERLRAKFPDLRLVVGLWNAQGELTRTRKRLQGVGAELITPSLTEALDHLQEQPAPAPEDAAAK